MSDFSDFSGSIDLASNPDPRCPVVLVLDSSTSMNEVLEGQTETSLAALNSGLDVLVTELNRDPLAKRRVELSVVSFGSEVTPATAFNTVDKIVLPTLVPSGATSLGGAVEVALDAIEARKREYKSNGIDYYKPWVLLITDGIPTDDTTEAERRVKEAEAAKKLSFFAVGVEGADFGRLSKFSELREPLKLKGVNFAELFVWLSASQSAVSASQPGDGVALPSPAGWAEV
jgi:uncharacterized protein YegL